MIVNEIYHYSRPVGQLTSRPATASNRPSIGHARMRVGIRNETSYKVDTNSLETGLVVVRVRHLVERIR